MKPKEFKQRREALGLSQTEMAAYLGVHQGTVYRWENGTRKPSKQAAVLVEHAFSMAEDAKRNGRPLPDWRKLMTEFSSRVG